ncbi:MAG: TetR family transcriptional regulator [Rhizobacter sp.]|jgi:AcrR family transcriptional regulator|nr:TetR family transcriptional regulator [Rhizobacter sp.]
MAVKRPRRTAQRILEIALDLFNRYGEPNVSTSAISAELGISAGNLYYHFKSKEEIINLLFDRYEEQLDALLPRAWEVCEIEDAWALLHSLFALIWSERFLYRDLNDLLSKNRRLEHRFQGVLARKTQAVQALLGGLRCHEGLGLDATSADAVSTAMVVVLTYWLSFEYVRDPRHALDHHEADAAQVRGAFHTLSLLMPYLDEAQRAKVHSLAAAPSTRPGALAMGTGLGGRHPHGQDAPDTEAGGLDSAVGALDTSAAPLDTEPAALDAASAASGTPQWPFHSVSSGGSRRATPTSHTPTRKS